jgi:hypothetical protein
VWLAIGEVGLALDDTGPSDIEGEPSISQEQHLALTLFATALPFGTP